MHTLYPSPSQKEYTNICTRPTPIPPDRAELSVMEVGHLSLPSGNIFPETLPMFTTLAWCTKGSFHLIGRGWSMHTQKGQLVAFGPGQYVKTDAGPEGCTAFYLLMDGSSIDNLLADTGLWTGTFPCLGIPERWLEYIAANIHDLSTQPTLATTGISLFQDAARQAERAAKDQLVWKACCYFQRNWNQPKTNVEALLKNLNVSRSSLSPRFKAQTGVTMLHYLNDIRFYNAIRMLANDALPIRIIAKRCGIPDPAYFSHWFHARAGRPPREMKEKL